MAVFFLSLAVFAIFFVLMSVRLIFIRNGEFRGTCSTQSPYLDKQGMKCGYCGKNLGENEVCANTKDQPIKTE